MLISVHIHFVCECVCVYVWVCLSHFGLGLYSIPLGQSPHNDKSKFIRFCHVSGAYEYICDNISCYNGEKRWGNKSLRTSLATVLAAYGVCSNGIRMNGRDSTSYTIELLQSLASIVAQISSECGSDVGKCVDFARVNGSADGYEDRLKLN